MKPRQLERIYLQHFRHYRRMFLPLVGEKLITGQVIDRAFVWKASVGGALVALRMAALHNCFFIFRFEVAHE